MTAFENLSSSQKTRASLHRDVRTIGTETCHFLGLEITKPALEIVAELVYKKMSVYGADLEAFAKHAKRSTINAEDVKLLVRRWPSLKTHLNIVTPSPKEKRRKTASKVQETPASKQKEPEASTSNRMESEASTSKFMESEASTSKEKESVIPTYRQKEVEEANQKETDKQSGKAEMDSIMDIDDMIDLTFD
ncbi:hypothetical protein PYW08_004312 [Mythimna loreyi]|uniref:Uncharacterized protein n=1 Tax=Mythimna loreyi TaxID=667449 RepID=A0ACC2QPI7_9NEOP|nr:hypothetical protein PYW08_004312 [Mythimna loreyi]